VPSCSVNLGAEDQEILTYMIKPDKKVKSDQKRSHVSWELLKDLSKGNDTIRFVY
jgi:hypothetical protein